MHLKSSISTGSRGYGDTVLPAAAVTVGLIVKMSERLIQLTAVEQQRAQARIPIRNEGPIHSIRLLES